MKHYLKNDEVIRARMGIDRMQVPTTIPVSHLLEVVIQFWRDFFRSYSPYTALPVGKTKLMNDRWLGRGHFRPRRHLGSQAVQRAQRPGRQVGVSG